MVNTKWQMVQHWPSLQGNSKLDLFNSAMEQDWGNVSLTSYCHMECPKPPVHIQMNLVAHTAKWQVAQRLGIDEDPELVIFCNFCPWSCQWWILYSFLSFWISPMQSVPLLSHYTTDLKLSLDGEKLALQVHNRIFQFIT